MLDFFLFTKENVSGFGQFNYFIIIKLIYKFLKIFILDWFFIFTILLVLITLLKSKNRETLIKSKTRILALLKTFFPYFFLIVVILIFQLMFYTAQIPTGMRYDFPALFLFIIFCTWHATTMIICRAHLHRAYFLIFWIVLQFVKLVLIRILVMLAIRWVNKQLIMNWLRGMLKQLHMLFICPSYS